MEKEVIALMIIVGGLVFSMVGLMVMDRLFKWPLGRKW